MHPSLQKLESELTTALTGLSSAQTQATPAAHPEKWSIQQIAEHLSKTYQFTIPVLETRLEKRAPTLARPSLRQRLFQFFIISLGRFPSGRLSPEAVSPSRQPATLRSGDEILTRIHAELTRLDSLIDQGSQLFGPDRRAASHMILGPLSMDQWARFHLVHGRHHIRQMQAIRAA